MENIAVVGRMEMMFEDTVREIVDRLCSSGWKVLVIDEGLFPWFIEKRVEEEGFDIHSIFIITSDPGYREPCSDLGWNVVNVVTRRNKRSIPIYASVTVEHAVDFLNTAYKILRTTKGEVECPC